MAQLALALLLLGSLLLTFGAGWLGARVTEPALHSFWYRRLRRPDWAPSGPRTQAAWKILCALMAVAAWLVGTADGRRGQSGALTYYGLQLVLHLVWSVVFYGIRKPSMALLVMLILWIIAVATMLAFWAVRPAAGWLMLPQIAWLTLTALVNYRVAQDNA